MTREVMQHNNNGNTHNFLAKFNVLSVDFGITPRHLIENKAKIVNLRDELNLFRKRLEKGFVNITGDTYVAGQGYYNGFNIADIAAYYGDNDILFHPDITAGMVNDVFAFRGGRSALKFAIAGGLKLRTDTGEFVVNRNYLDTIALLVYKGCDRESIKNADLYFLRYILQDTLVEHNGNDWGSAQTEVMNAIRAGYIARFIKECEARNLDGDVGINECRDILNRTWVGTGNDEQFRPNFFNDNFALMKAHAMKILEMEKKHLLRSGWQDIINKSTSTHVATNFMKELNLAGDLGETLGEFMTPSDTGKLSGVNKTLADDMIRKQNFQQNLRSELKEEIKDRKEKSKIDASTRPGAWSQKAVLSLTAKDMALYR